MDLNLTTLKESKIDEAKNLTFIVYCCSLTLNHIIISWVRIRSERDTHLREVVWAYYFFWSGGDHD